MASSTLALLPHGSSSSSRRTDASATRAPPPPYSAHMGPGGVPAYAPAYSVSPGVAPGPYGAGVQPLPAAPMPGPFPAPAVSRDSVDRWAQSSSAQLQPAKVRPILSQHGYYMCIAVSIVVAIGLVIAFGFFVMQRRFAQIMVHKK
ncbi:hypothetical protein V5799_009481 [Amblyomma americanum]|uniref:Uncharacterized protein n=1 Tax=Amblyomma americanum TaxID=6943 RepID=A0AAQ4E3I4_AMBAM